ncbi:hypothetical protein PVK06_034913 [Gossypium arboreum]|uniref:Pentatricopeptide repeat-containing protein n=1 Tax=Gossypium arboreum TaxID=29729 RepID=A0ABR0NHP9_GOSAR|nr:hypothetical protein PVK06_034913 [Gossypium arboreum]
MIKKGCAPDISSYNIMINGDREARRIEETMELFHEIFQKGPIADTLTYNTLTQGMCQIGRVSSARELLRKMLAFGQVPNVVTCLNLLNGLCKSDKLKEALELFRAMRNSKLELNIVCYNILIGGLCKSRHIEVGKELFHKISVYGLKPDVYTYAIIINGFCKEGLPDENCMSNWDDVNFIPWFSYCQLFPLIYCFLRSFLPLIIVSGYFLWFYTIVALQPQWEHCNALVLSWILNSVSQELSAGIVFASSTALV